MKTKQAGRQSKNKLILMVNSQLGKKNPNQWASVVRQAGISHCTIITTTAIPAVGRGNPILYAITVFYIFNKFGNTLSACNNTLSSQLFRGIRNVAGRGHVVGANVEEVQGIKFIVCCKGRSVGMDSFTQRTWDRQCLI